MLYFSTSIQRMWPFKPFLLPLSSSQVDLLTINLIQLQQLSAHHVQTLIPASTQIITALSDKCQVLMAFLHAVFLCLRYPTQIEAFYLLLLLILLIHLATTKNHVVLFKPITSPGITCMPFLIYSHFCRKGESLVDSATLHRLFLIQM